MATSYKNLKFFCRPNFEILGVDGFWDPPVISDPLDLETPFLAGLEAPEC